MTKNERENLLLGGAAGTVLGLILALLANQVTPQPEPHLLVTCYHGKGVRSAYANNAVVMAGRDYAIMGVMHEKDSRIETLKGDMFCGLTLEEE